MEPQEKDCFCETCVNLIKEALIADSSPDARLVLYDSIRLTP